MTFMRYAKESIGDYVLVLISSWCCALVVENAFFLSSVAARPGISFAVCALLLLVLFAVSYKRKWLGLGAGIYVLLLAALVVASLALSTGENPYDDAEGNYLYLVVVLILSATASFLLTRTLPGSVVWLLVVTFACSTVQALYESNALIETLGAVFCALALVVYRNFMLGLVRADVARSTSRFAGITTALTAVLASGALACAAWFLIIAPLSPGTLSIKLITDYRHLPIVELRGVADEQPELNLEMTSDQLTDGTAYTTDDLVKGASDVVISARQLLNQIVTGGGNSGAGTGTDAGQEGGLDSESTDEQYDAQSYTSVFPVIVLVLAVIALIALLVGAFFLIRRRMRMRRLRRMLAQEPAKQVTSLYLFLLSRFERLGFTLGKGSTLSEYAAHTASHMATFDGEAKVSFAKLTRIYEACLYGGVQPDEDQTVLFVAYYLAFWKAARAYLGNYHYFFKSFRL